MMNRLQGRACSLWPVALPGILLALAGCDSGGVADPAVGNDSIVRQLLERDAAFATMAYEQGVADAYQAFLAEDAVQLPDGGYPIIGQDAIYENIQDTLEGTEYSLTWEAVDAVVAGSGDIGYTWGNYYFEGVDEQGEPFGSEGKYVNIWRKSDDKWKVLLDISNQNEPAYIESLDESAVEADSQAITDGTGVESGPAEDLF